LEAIVFKNSEEFNNKESYEKFYNEYSVLNLTETVEDDWGYRMQGFYCNIENTPETFEALKKLCESDDYDVCGFVMGGARFEPISSVTNLYTADPAKTSVGDVNADNTVDLTDLSELALAVIGDIELTDSQKSAADINGDGEVNVSDLARLKQFVSNSITSLR
ncbi:MAG: dockerin type I repeat-containing protein, partial [Oscillospiraceae bacterium]|nr:dockerin type I repeat-containing protein [Oscillospiraceae bacterium]